MRRTRDWIAEVHRSGDWRALADWLVAHREYLAETMADFAVNMAHSEREPTARQFMLLVSLRGGVEALQRLESMASGSVDTVRMHEAPRRLQ